MEILNIEYHMKRMVVRALERSRSKREAARKLGISQCGLNKMIDRFRITFERDDNGLNKVRVIDPSIVRVAQVQSCERSRRRSRSKRPYTTTTWIEKVVSSEEFLKRKRVLNTE